MKPKHLLSDYLNGRISGEELRRWLASDGSREARQTLEILDFEDSARKTLKEFPDAQDPAQHLAEKVANVESWIAPEKPIKPAVSKPRLSSLLDADVVGHGKPSRKKKKTGNRKKALHHSARRKTWASNRNSPRKQKKK